MNLDKPDAQEALKKITDGINELNLATNVPREKDEVKKLKDDRQALALLLVVAFMCFFVSIVMHGVRSHDESRATVQLAILKQSKNNVEYNRDRMMESYNAQMVPMLERQVKDLKEEVRFQKAMSNTNRVLYEACLIDVSK